MKFLNKLCITVILVLIILILSKNSSKVKIDFFNKVYNSNISFSYFNKMYDKYIKGEEIKEVFDEKLDYISKEKYLDGAKLTFSSNTIIPVLESGVVIYKSHDTIIIQRIDGIDEVYANIKNSNVKLYDYVKKGEILGEVDNALYLSYKKDGVFLDYEEYIE